MRPDNQPVQNDDLSSTGIGNTNNSYSGLVSTGTDQTANPSDLVGTQDQTSELKGLGANLALGMPLQYAGDILSRERELFYGENEYKQSLQQQENLKNSLQQTANALPTDDQHWYSTGAARFVGSLFDPLTIASGGLAEVGLKAAVPSIARILETDAGETLGTRILKSAVKGTVSGFAGANISSGVQAAVEYGSPDHITMNDYLSNLINWSAMGAIHGVASPILNDIWKNVSGKYEPKTLTDDAVSMQNDSPIKEEAAKAQADTAITQANAGKKVNVAAQILAEQNRAIDEVNAKQALYEQLPEDKKANIPSPIKQLEDNVTQAKANLDDSEGNIKQILNNISDEYDALDSDKLKNEALSTPLPRLVESISKITATDGLSDETTDQLNQLKDSLKSSSYSFGPAQTIYDALKLDRPYLVPKEDRDMIASLHDPINEADMIDQMSKENYSQDNQDVLNNRTTAIRSNNTPVKSMPLYSDHLPALNDALDDFANRQLDVKNAQDNLEYKTAEKNDLTGPVNEMAQSVINDTHNIDEEANIPSVEDTINDSFPYENHEPTLGDLQATINRYLDQGLLTQDEIDSMTPNINDDHDGKFLDIVSKCLLENNE